MMRLGEHDKAAYLFDPAEVERFRRLREGEAGDVIDRVDIDAASDDPAESRKAAIRAAWLDAIDDAVDSAGEFSTGRARAYVDPDYRHGGPQVGALITSLVRRKCIEWTGKWDELGDTYNRHGLAPCKVYRIVGDLS